MISKQARIGFTLVEILVATTVFMSLMAVLSISFQRLSSGGQRGLQVLELHAKADAVMRNLEEDLRNIPNVATMHLQPESSTEPGTFTFMAQVSDTHPNFTNKGRTVPDYNPFESNQYRFTDLIWVRYEWENGSFKRGQSRKNRINSGSRQWAYQHLGLTRYVSASGQYVKSVNLEQSDPHGVQSNAIAPMLQRHFDFFIGKGSVNSIDFSTGESAATAGEKIQVYKVVGGSWRYQRPNWYTEFFDEVDSPWRVRTQEYQGGDLRHNYTTLDLGNEDPLSDPEAYAVRNLDGKSVNKDRLNLLGAEDETSSGIKLYPNQMREMFAGVEFFEMELVSRRGHVITSSDEEDRLSDGSKSLDISGVEALSGAGQSKRPTHIRISFLLHSIPNDEPDEVDFDNDGDTDELLMVAVGDLIETESHATRKDAVEAYKKYALNLGYVAVLFNQSVQLGY